MIVTGDFHLGLRMKNSPMIPLGRGKVSTHTFATLSRFYSICLYADTRHLTAIAILGDIFHTPYPDVHTFSMLIEVFKQFPKINFYVIEGNHDCDAHSSGVHALSRCVHENVYVYPAPTYRTVDGRSSKFGCLFYPHVGYGEEFEIYDGESDESTILLGHGHLEGIKTNGFELESTGSAMLLSREAASKFQQVFLGHIHKPSRIRQKRKDLEVIYPGSPFPCTFGELGERKGFWDMESDRFVKFSEITDYLLPFYHDAPPYVCLGEVTIRNGKASVDWGDRHPKNYTGNNRILLVKVRELDDPDSFGMERTKTIMQRFADRGFIVSSYERKSRTTQKANNRNLESIKGEINHEEVFEDYVNANYSDHKYLPMVVRSGKKLIGGSV